MRFTLEVSTDGAAFEADPLELQRVIKNVANQAAKFQTGPERGMGPPASGPAIDANGNTCGKWILEET
jgi:hypothetical protein